MSICASPPLQGGGFGTGDSPLDRFPSANGPCWAALLPGAHPTQCR